MSFRRADCLVGLGLVAVTAVGLWAFLPSESATRVFGLLDNVVGVESEKIDFPLPAAVAPGTPGMSVAIATYRRAELLKVFIPRYLKEPFINEIVISDDFNSNDAQTLRDWLPTSGISPHDQARVSIYNDTGARLGSFQNKVRAIALAKYSWIALIDSDNFATSAHYWGPLIAFWNATYGSAPPPPGNRTAERRAIHAGAWHKWNDINSPDAHLAFDNMGIATVCTRDGELAPPGSHRDPLASLGAGCWEEAFKGSYLFFNLGNHVMHRATFLPPLREYSPAYVLCGFFL